VLALLLLAMWVMIRTRFALLWHRLQPTSLALFHLKYFIQSVVWLTSKPLIHCRINCLRCWRQWSRAWRWCICSWKVFIV